MLLFDFMVLLNIYRKIQLFHFIVTIKDQIHHMHVDFRSYIISIIVTKEGNITHVLLCFVSQ